LEQLLAFFVYLTKEMQLAHGESETCRISHACLGPHSSDPHSERVILATSDTFLLQWLEKGASAWNSLLYDPLTVSCCRAEVGHTVYYPRRVTSSRFFFFIRLDDIHTGRASTWTFKSFLCCLLLPIFGSGHADKTCTEAVKLQK